jgi:hypothetical protein
MSVFNFNSGKNMSAYPQIQSDLTATNLNLHCDPRTVGTYFLDPQGKRVLDVESKAGKIAVEDSICNLTVNGNLTVKGQAEICDIICPEDFTVRAGRDVAFTANTGIINNQLSDDLGTFTEPGGQTYTIGTMTLLQKLSTQAEGERNLVLRGGQPTNTPTDQSRNFNILRFSQVNQVTGPPLTTLKSDLNIRQSVNNDSNSRNSSQINIQNFCNGVTGTEQFAPGAYLQLGVGNTTLTQNSNNGGITLKTQQTTLPQATAASFVVGSGTTAAPGGIKMNIGNGGFGCTGASPTVSAGTLSPNSSNFAGRIAGNGANNTYTLTFTNAFASVPVVICTATAATTTCSVTATTLNNFEVTTSAPLATTEFINYVVIALTS